MSLMLVIGLLMLLGYLFIPSNHADIVQDCTTAIQTDFLSIPMKDRLDACIENTYYSLEFTKASLLILGGALSTSSALVLLLYRLSRNKRSKVVEGVSEEAN